MRRIVPILALCRMLLAVAPAAAQTLPPIDAAKLREKLVTTDPGPAGKVLRQWWRDGTAAGNVGDYYDNRDGDHSPLNRGLFPQLSAITYSAEDVKLRKHWAGQGRILPAVVFGNSSTSAPPTQGGSNPRQYYVAGNGLAFLATEYVKNNLYIYPEHRDHDPGHNGKGDGFGDLYPTNTPYLIISQGSSGSDQPFMRAVPLTLAAFRPEVKRKLIETGTLMATVQMILRRTSKQLKGPPDYLTGKAHPTVFEGSAVDDLAMINLAHALTLETLPPVVQLKVVEEDQPVMGRDCFESPERLGDTPAVIARVHRSKERKRRLVVSAAESHDLNKAALTYTWVILRGDPERIRITPRNPEGSVAEITVAYHERRPIAPGAALASNRVDIGVFVHNGTYHSAPAFVTFYSLDNEARTYDAQDRIREIAYGMGDTELRVTDWERVLAVLARDAAAGKQLGLTDGQRGALAALAERYGERAAARRAAQEKVKDAEARLKQANAQDQEAVRKQVAAAQKAAAEPQRALDTLLETSEPALGSSLRSFFEGACRGAARAKDRQRTLRATLDRVDASQPHAGLRKGLAQLGLAGTDDLTVYGRSQLEHAALVLLVADYFPGMVEVTYQPNYVDQRLTVPKRWRDVYRYDGAGAFTGWTRYRHDQDPEEFNHEGLLVLEKDRLGRCTKARAVRYVRAASPAVPNPNPLQVLPGTEIVSYAFAGPEDPRGKRVGNDAGK